MEFLKNIKIHEVIGFDLNNVIFVYSDSPGLYQYDLVLGEGKIYSSRDTHTNPDTASEEAKRAIKFLLAEKSGAID